MIGECSLTHLVFYVGKISRHSVSGALVLGKIRVRLMASFYDNVREMC